MHPKTAVDQAAAKLIEISRLIKELEGLPVDYSLARRLNEVTRQIDESVSEPLEG